MIIQFKIFEQIKNYQDIEFEDIKKCAFYIESLGGLKNRKGGYVEWTFTEDKYNIVYDESSYRLNLYFIFENIVPEDANKRIEFMEILKNNNIDFSIIKGQTYKGTIEIYTKLKLEDVEKYSELYSNLNKYNL